MDVQKSTKEEGAGVFWVCKRSIVVCKHAEVSSLDIGHSLLAIGYSPRCSVLETAPRRVAGVGLGWFGMVHTKTRKHEGFCPQNTQKRNVD